VSSQPSHVAKSPFPNPHVAAHPAARFEQALRSRAAVRPPVPRYADPLSDSLMHLDLLRRAAAGDEAIGGVAVQSRAVPPKVVQDALRKQADALAAAFIARGPWQHPQQVRGAGLTLEV